MLAQAGPVATWTGRRAGAAVRARSSPSRRQRLFSSFVHATVGRRLISTDASPPPPHAKSAAGAAPTDNGIVSGVVVDLDFGEALGGASPSTFSVLSDSTAWLADADGPAGELERLVGPEPRGGFGGCYALEELLGQGTFGDIYRASAVGAAEGPRRRRCAVKVFRPSGKGADEAGRSSCHVECALLGRFEHPCIVKMYEYFKDGDDFRVVLELCDGGDLFGRIVERFREVKSGFEEPVARAYLVQMLSAVAYMHAQRVVHQDIKPENFVISGKPGTAHADVVKLCDFGSCVALTEEAPRVMDKTGTLSYTAPEVYAGRGAAVAADMWSMGVVLYVLLAGTNPFQVPGTSSTQETIDRILAGEFEQQRPAWLHASSSAQGLVCALLAVDETERLTVRQALRHAFLRGADPAGLAQHASSFVALLWRYSTLALAQRLALVGCAWAASEDDVAQCGIPCRDLFLALDEDQDGRLTCSEFASGLARMLDDIGSPMPASKLEERALAVDLNKTGAVEWTEFLAVAMLPLAGSLSEVAEPTATAQRVLAKPPRPYQRVSASSKGRTTGGVLQRWARKEDSAGVLPAKESGSEPAPTLACLRFVLSTVYQSISNSLEQTLPSPSKDCDANANGTYAISGGLTLCALTSDVLVVCAVRAGDAEDLRSIHEWNEACTKQGQAYKELRVDTCVASVNCRQGDVAHMLDALKTALSGQKDDVRQARFVSFRPRTFDVVLKKSSGQSVGLQIAKKHPLQFGLVIHGIEPGLLADWNASHPDRAVERGNIIVAVDGQRGTRRALIDRMSRCECEISLHVLDVSTLAL